MFFALSKILGFLTVPSNVLAVVAITGVCLLMTRWLRLARVLLIGSIGLLVVLGFSPLSNALLLPLSERFPAWESGGRDPEGVIVLGGAIDPEVSAARDAVELDSSAERMTALVMLARRFPEARIVFSGGSGNLIQNTFAEAPFARKLLAEAGISGDRFVFEETSRTTYENAVNSRDLLKPKAGERWLLVTSSFHMPRSVGAFRKAGFDVEAFPVDWRTRGWRDLWQPFARLSSGLARADVAVHEWTGLVIYWLTDRSSALFPAPHPAATSRGAAGQAGRRP
ncbi:YdcF family protein [Bradyrhizobium sp. LHD-71]|uniref:YdcF family protein n=1 Tax=Bradyrhizobium sp. LHD-71 TaxID=3072141 RepID=UPI0028101D43|nr:YdcF family protein [Bradyrhizobium sp. LHD-71]MDQ8726326.1 YdcF family protein [Bradyrhizobium sp. LHD-71]